MTRRVRLAKAFNGPPASSATASILDMSILHIFMHMHMRIYCHSGISKHCSQTISWRRAMFRRRLCAGSKRAKWTGLVKSINARSRGPTAKCKGGKYGPHRRAWRRYRRRFKRLRPEAGDPQGRSHHSCFQQAVFPIHAIQSLGGREMAYQERHHHRSRLGAAETWRCLQRCRGGARTRGQQSRRAGGWYVPRLRLPGDRHGPRARLR